jgi:hypothetical protein
MNTIETTTKPISTWSYSTSIVDGKVCVTIAMGHSDGERKYARTAKRLRSLIARAERICAKRNAKSRTAEQLLADVAATTPSTFKSSPRIHAH